MSIVEFYEGNLINFTLRMQRIQNFEQFLSLEIQ